VHNSHLGAILCHCTFDRSYVTSEGFEPSRHELDPGWQCLYLGITSVPSIDATRAGFVLPYSSVTSDNTIRETQPALHTPPFSGHPYMYTHMMSCVGRVENQTELGDKFVRLVVCLV